MEVVELQRRTLVGVALTAGVVTACQSPDDAPSASSPTDSSSTPSSAPARDDGARQRGVSDPLPRQRYLGLRVLALTGGTAPDDVRALLAGLGATVVSLGAPDGLTVTVGVGPDVVRAARGADAVGARDLPAFASDAFEDDAVGGDLMLQVCADRRATVSTVADRLLASLGDAVTPVWSIDGHRGEVDGVAARNVLGFYDGIAGPDTPAEQDDAVWTDASDGLADATICVVRRIRLDHRRFGLQPVAEQERVIGRSKRSGAPLSGGGITTDVNLQAKSGSGVLDIPNDAHVRRAHPLFSGAGRLMLRRGYSYRAAPDDQGLAFICFQRDLEMFVKTQNSMDGGDRLLDFATTTGSGTFLVLPGYDAASPLGAALYA